MELLSSDKQFVDESDYILSIVPPRDALHVALRVKAALQASARRESALYFLDLNAISPLTVQTISAELSADGLLDTVPLRYIDGGIIGDPPKLPDPSDPNSKGYLPSIVVSGEHRLADATRSGAHLAEVLHMKHIHHKLGSASGLKICFASIHKGLAGIAIQAFTTAEQLGVLPELRSHLESYYPAVGAAALRSVASVPPKAYRWVEEMNQIALTMELFGGFESTRNKQRERNEGNEHGEDRLVYGQGGDLFRDVGEIFKFVADDTELGKEKMESREKGKTAEDVARLCAANLNPPKKLT